jgi:MYXO-CTERM domain-containing protein
MTAMVGRVLGLTSAMEGNATYPVYVPGNIDKRMLGADDIAGITYIYGDDTCAMRGTPEGICTGAPLEDCPPRPDTGDAGTGTRDGGTGTPDTGTGGGDTGAMLGDGGVDGGTGGDDGGCSVGSLDAESTPGGLALLLFTGAAVLRRRR